MSKRLQYYSIGKVSSLCNVPVKTLRYYDKIGLLVPQYRKEGSNYRYYEHAQLLTLFIIRKLRLLGIPLKEIQAIIQNSDTSTAMEQCVISRMGEISRTIQNLQEQYALAESLIERLHEGNMILQVSDTQSMEGEIRIENIPVTDVIFTRRIKSNYHNADVSVDRWFELFEIANKYHLKIAGSIILTYHNAPLEQFYNKDCDLEACIQVNMSKPSLEFKKFGGFLAVTAIHIGKNDEIIQTHAKAIKWLNPRGYVIDGPISEEYLLSPIDIEDVDKHVTKIIIPVKKA